VLSAHAPGGTNAASRRLADVSNPSALASADTQSPEQFYVLRRSVHDDLIAAVYRQRGYLCAEASVAAEISGEAAWHGIRTHNGIKALDVEAKHGSRIGGCNPGAAIRRRAGRFESSEVWDAQRKLGQPVALEAMNTCMRLAERFGIGQVSVDNAFHYLWGGAYVLHAAKHGYIAYTNCTSTCAEVVPHLGKTPTLGTNPHSWAFPTQDLLGYPILVDWATSVIAWGRVTQCAREGRPLPAGAALDAEGRPTTDPSLARSLLPFGGHKGYGLSLINEIMAAYIGGSVPTRRDHWEIPGAKPASCFYFQAIHPESLSAGSFAGGKTQSGNVQEVLRDILAHGNASCRLPGQFEAEAAARSRRNDGLLFTAAEISRLNEFAAEGGSPPINENELPLAL